MRLPSKQISPESGRSSVASKWSSVRLAAAAGPDDRHEFAFADRELDALQHGDHERPFAVTLADVVGAPRMLPRARGA